MEETAENRAVRVAVVREGPATTTAFINAAAFGTTSSRSRAAGESSRRARPSIGRRRGSGRKLSGSRRKEGYHTDVHTEGNC